MKKLLWLLVVALLVWWTWSYYAKPSAQAPTANSADTVEAVDAVLGSLDDVDFEKELNAVDEELGNL